MRPRIPEYLSPIFSVFFFSLFIVAVGILFPKLSDAAPTRIRPLFYFAAGTFEKAADEIAALSFLNSVEEGLPPVLKRAFKKPIKIEFSSGFSKLSTPLCRKSLTKEIAENLNSDASLDSEESEKSFFSNLFSSDSIDGLFSHKIDEFYGSVSLFGKTIKLNSDFKAIIQRPEQEASTFGCGHRNTYRLAIATVFHEIGHLYDFMNQRSKEEEALHVRCSDVPFRDDFKDPECIGDRHYGRTVSSRKDFELLAGWVDQGFLFTTLEKRNFLNERSADAYEFTSPSESFSVNLEFYLLDREFKCRKKLLYEYFSRHFQWEPHPGFNCSQTQVVRIQSGDPAEPHVPYHLDAKRVYQIHYLFAGKGEETESRWGHAMFRIITCSPDPRRAVGPDCLGDISQHIVVSFRANITDSMTSWIKGLLGDYPSQMFLLPMTSVVDEYTKLEARNLYSVPLNLTEEEKNRFITNVYTHFWSYRGKYKFLSNNCANESLWFLQAVSDRNPELNIMDITTPVGLYEKLARIGMTDMSVLQNGEDKAIKYGYFFKSKRESLLKTFKSVAVYLPYFELDDYANESTAAQRVDLFIRAVRLGNVERPSFAAKLFLIEKYVQRYLGNRFQEELNQIMQKDDKAIKVLRKKLVKVLAADPKFKYEAFIRESYGVPLKEEIETIEENRENIEANDKSIQEVKKLVASVLDNPLLASLKPLMSKLQEVEKNLVFFSRNMDRSRNSAEIILK